MELFKEPGAFRGNRIIEIWLSWGHLNVIWRAVLSVSAQMGYIQYSLMLHSLQRDTYPLWFGDIFRLESSVGFAQSKETQKKKKNRTVWNAMHSLKSRRSPLVFIKINMQKMFVTILLQHKCNPTRREKLSLSCVKSLGYSLCLGGENGVICLSGDRRMQSSLARCPTHVRLPLSRQFSPAIQALCGCWELGFGFPWQVSPGHEVR